MSASPPPHTAAAGESVAARIGHGDLATFPILTGGWYGACTCGYLAFRPTEQRAGAALIHHVHGALAAWHAAMRRPRGPVMPG